ncbi:uncharacterized protein LOC110875743 [Helianthus annuus]|uniref:uncharacterized protein LOC110875743 n=1 Tax=Helianthus annuus TaxID=4232 RepID=UPI000B8FFF7D|nr:uncharacterized protein LOC110875743 [Helianthus annuus]
MSKRLVLRIVDDLEANYDYFKQKADARGALGFTGIQKYTSALRILAYGNTTDINDEYLKMGEKTTRDTLEHFCRGIIDVYGARYLRTPTWDDLQKIYEVHSTEHGLPEEWISGKAPKASFYANGNYYPHGYYLSDGIYPRYSIFVKTFSDPIEEKKRIL